MMIKKGDSLKLHKKAVGGTDSNRIMIAASDEKRNQVHMQNEVYVEGFKSPFLASYLVKVNEF